MNMDFSDASAPRADRRFQDDTSKLRQSMLDTLETWLPRMLSGGRFYRGEFLCGSLGGEQGDSLKVKLQGEYRGFWKDWATGEGGDVFDLIQGVLGTDFAGAAKVARGIAGLEIRPSKAAKKAVIPESLKKKSWTMPVCRHIFDAVSQTSAYSYLISRGISAATISKAAGQDHDLCMAHSIYHGPTSSKWPAMIGKVRAADGVVTGIHRTFLTPDGRKAPVEPVKMMLGECAGGAVRLGVWRPGDVLNVCEGIETGLSAMQLFGLSNMWCALSTSGMKALQLPKDALVTVYADADPAGVDAAEYFAGKHKDSKVIVAYPGLGLNDFNDMLKYI